MPKLTSVNMSSSATSSDVLETVLLHDTIDVNQVISQLLLFGKAQLAQFGQEHCLSHHSISIELFRTDCVYIIFFHNKMAIIKGLQQPLSGMPLTLHQGCSISYPFSNSICTETLKFRCSQTKLRDGLLLSLPGVWNYLWQNSFCFYVDHSNS